MPLQLDTLLLPDENDILLNDVTETSMKSIEDELDVHTAPRPPVFPVYGVIRGSCFRMWVCLVLQKKDIMINAVFLYDTGSPYTHLSQETFEKLGYKNHTPDSSVVNVHGSNMMVYVSKNHFSHINLLGQDFSMCSRLLIKTSFDDFSFELDRNNDNHVFK